MFNNENESFMQETRLIENEYSVNLPTRFYYGKKWNNGWPSSGTGLLAVNRKGDTQTLDVLPPQVLRLRKVQHLRRCIWTSLNTCYQHFPFQLVQAFFNAAA